MFQRHSLQISPTLAVLLISLLANLGFGAERPNVIVIISDDQGWADIGYNNPRVSSPNLDKLANGGAKLTSHYVMPQCTPTRVALMTGRYPGRFGTAGLHANNKPAFPLGTPTLSGMFQDCGYDTFMSGKWHLGSTPKHGPNHFRFDESHGSLTGAVGMYDHRYQMKTNPWDGLDLGPLLFVKRTLPDRDLYWIWHPQVNRWALRHQNWKIVKYGGGEPKRDEWHLFNLSKDPEEAKNVAAEFPEVVTAMHDRFLRQRRRDLMK